MTDPVLDALAKALENDPDNGPLWQHYGQMLAAAGRARDAAKALTRALDCGAAERSVLPALLPLLRASGQAAEAVIRAESWLERHEDPAIRLELARALLARGAHAQARAQYDLARAADARLRDRELDAIPAAAAPAAATVAPADSGSDAEWAAQFDWGDLRVRFDDVVGLDDVKRQIRLRIIAPFEKPEVYRAFGRKAGGGILLYGPPGCGKTFLARATAGELGARFVSVGIHELVDKYWGESEKLVHALFDGARRRAPTVLFFDEFDALGAHRARGESQFWKTLVNQMLQEMDGVSGSNEGVLVCAATNMPWNVDPAFRRPGRFDRVVLVPPPDAAGRAAQLRMHLAKIPGGARIDADKLAAATDSFTGADLKALCERAAEQALERSLESDVVHEITHAELDRAARAMNSSAGEWLATARNHARYANDGGHYDELVEYLRKVKRW
jgi:AAA+ superfamily predicted ATPase